MQHEYKMVFFGHDRCDVSKEIVFLTPLKKKHVEKLNFFRHEKITC